MKRYVRDPNAARHLRALVDSAREDGLDDDARRRVAERLGLSLSTMGPLHPTPDATPAAMPWPSVGAIGLTVIAVATGSMALPARRLARRLLRETPNPPYAARVSAALVDPLEQQ